MAKAKTTTKKKPTKKPAKKPAKQQPAKKQPAKKQPAKKPAKQRLPTALEAYLENVAANQSLGLDRAMDTTLNMVCYEFPEDLPELQKQAKSGLDGGIGNVVEMARAKAIVGLGPAEVEAMLKAIVEAERYEGIDE